MLGDAATGELMALKRLSIPIARTTRTRLHFPAVSELGDSPVGRVSVYLLSDSYLGLDRVLEVDVGGVGAQQDGSNTAGGRGADDQGRVHGQYVRSNWPALEIAEPS